VLLFYKNFFANGKSGIQIPYIFNFTYQNHA
jgi:hypothetical protein